MIPECKCNHATVTCHTMTEGVDPLRQIITFQCFMCGSVLYPMTATSYGDSIEVTFAPGRSKPDDPVVIPWDLADDLVAVCRGQHRAHTPGVRERLEAAIAAISAEGQRT